MGDRPSPARNRAAAGPKGAGAFRRLAELFALTGFAIAQPLLDVTGKAPDFFLYRRANTNEMRLFVVLVVLTPPLLLWLAELVVGLVSKPAARALHLVFCGGLFAVLLVQVGKQLGLFTGLPLGVLAVLLGAGVGVLFARSPGFRQFVSYATPAPLVFALLFTFTSPAGALVRGTEVDRGEGRFIANRPPVVYVFLDEFPLRALLDGKGALDEKRFPNFARLAKMSNWYPNATGVTGWTPFAAPAMANGQYPKRAVAASYIEYPETLFTLLAGTYDMRAYETIGELCPPGMCLGVASGREVGMRALTRDTVGLTKEIVSPYPSTRDEKQQFVENAVSLARQQARGKGKPDAQEKFDEVGRNQPERLGPFLADLKPMPRPNLHYMHFLLPHAPYRYLPSGNLYARTPLDWPDPTATKDERQLTPADPLWSVVTKQRLVMQTGYLDLQLGAMLDRMEETGLLDQALLVVTADHGTGIEPGVRFRQYDDKNGADVAWVPLFVKTPLQKEGKVDRRNAQVVDIVPTIADVLDVEVPWEMEGVSLLGDPRPTDEKWWYDVPGTREVIDPKRWLPAVERGYASELVGDGNSLFALRPHADLVGKRLSDFTVGAPSPVTANLHDTSKPLDEVDPDSGVVPAAWFGELDRPVGDTSTWLLASVNGRIAGLVAAMKYDDTWRFAGMVDDKSFREGKQDVGLYELSGDSTLHPLRLVP